MNVVFIFILIFRSIQTVYTRIRWRRDKKWIQVHVGRSSALGAPVRRRKKAIGMLHFIVWHVFPFVVSWEKKSNSLKLNWSAILQVSAIDYGVLDLADSSRLVSPNSKNQVGGSTGGEEPWDRDLKMSEWKDITMVLMENFPASLLVQWSRNLRNVNDAFIGS